MNTLTLWIWKLQDAGILFLALAIGVNTWIVTQLAKHSRNPNANKNIKSHKWITFLVLSALAWQISNLMFGFNAPGLRFWGNLAYISGLLMAISYVRVLLTFVTQYVPPLKYKRFRWILYFTAILLSSVGIVIPPVKSVIIQQASFELILNYISAAVLTVGFIVIAFLTIYITTTYLSQLSQPLLVHITLLYTTLTILNNLILPFFIGPALWWFGPTFSTILTLFIYYLYKHQSAFNFWFYMHWFGRLMFILNGLLIMLAILLNLPLTTNLVTLIIISSFTNVLIIFLLNLKNNNLIINPYINLAQILQNIRNLEATQLNLNQKIALDFFRLVISKLFRTVYGDSRPPKIEAVIIYQFPFLDAPIIINLSQNKIELEANPRQYHRNFRHQYRLFIWKDTKVTFLYQYFINITAEIEKTLDIIFALGGLFALLYATYSYLFKANQFLEKRVQERTAQLKLANQKLKESQNKLNQLVEELKRANEQKTIFISVASHQLRTPVSILKNYINMFELYTKNTLTKDQRELLQRIKDAINQLAGIVTDILETSRIERGKFSLHLEYIQPAQIVRSLYQQFKTMADRKNLKFTLNIYPPADTLKLYADATKLQEAYSNLIANAIQYTEPNGKVDLFLYMPNAKWLIFAVKDTGIGIPEDKKHLLFKKFMRLDNAKKIRPDGTGIGLYLVRNVAISHNGKVWFKSKLGEGSTFYIAIPTDLKPNMK